MKVTLAPIDAVVLVCYFAVVLAIGFLPRRRRGDAVDFLLAGRSLTLPLFVVTLVSTWYGGILGVGEFSYLYGISNWIVQGVPYYIFSIIFAIMLAKRVRETNLLTIPDKLHQAYDKRTALVGAFLTFLLMTPAPYILMLAVLIQLVTGWSVLVCLFVGTLLSTVYLYFGGFRSDVYTDAFEFVMMFAGFGIILPFAFLKFGGWDFVAANVPPLHLSWNGSNPWQFVLVWFFIAAWTLVDPAFHQRCYAAQSGAVAQKGIAISIVFWFIFDAMTATAGLYARAVLPPLEQPVMAFPLLAEATLPPLAKGLFYIGMLATIMSTLNSLMFISATTVGRDIVWRWRSEPDDSTVTRYTQAGMLVSAALSITLSILIPSVIKLWYTLGTVIIPGLLIPLVTSYFDRVKVSAPYAFAVMLAGWLTSLGWLIAGWRQELGATHAYPLGIEPMYPGLTVSALVWVAGMLVRTQKS